MHTVLSSHSCDYYKYISPEEKISGRGPKLITSKQLVQILPIALVQVKEGNISEILLNESYQIIFSLYQGK